VKRRHRLSDSVIISALQTHRGMVSLAAKSLGASHNTILARAARSVAVRAALEFERTVLVDIAETKLAEAVDRGELPAVLFTLRTLGRNRGYVERDAVTNSEIEAEARRLAEARGLDAGEIIARARELVDGANARRHITPDRVSVTP
jgi:hypothetical protein